MPNKRGVGDFDPNGAKNRLKFFLDQISDCEFPNEQCRMLFAEWLFARFYQYSETLTKETISASVIFINAEPNPEEVIIQSINRPQKCFRQFFPTDTAIREAYRKRLKPQMRYAVRTKRKLRANKTSITDTVFKPRTIFKTLGIEL